MSSYRFDVFIRHELYVKVESKKKLSLLTHTILREKNACILLHIETNTYILTLKKNFNYLIFSISQARVFGFSAIR